MNGPSVSRKPIGRKAVGALAVGGASQPAASLAGSRCGMAPAPYLPYYAASPPQFIPPTAVNQPLQPQQWQYHGPPMYPQPGQHPGQHPGGQPQPPGPSTPSMTMSPAPILTPLPTPSPTPSYLPYPSNAPPGSVVPAEVPAPALPGPSTVGSATSHQPWPAMGYTPMPLAPGPPPNFAQMIQAPVPSPAPTPVFAPVPASAPTPAVLSAPTPVPTSLPSPVETTAPVLASVPSPTPVSASPSSPLSGPCPVPSQLPFRAQSQTPRQLRRVFTTGSVSPTGPELTRRTSMASSIGPVSPLNAVMAPQSTLSLPPVAPTAVAENTVGLNAKVCTSCKQGQCLPNFSCGRGFSTNMNQ